ncbi:MAG TPA: hypothetical protein VFV93_05635 [Thermomicrobiales bacterium]|nr:hypothetical protein [Thermomicrobiales bacterium]
MFDGAHLIEQVPLQDVDLLQRLNNYFATLELRLRQGQGWLIYNASGNRAGRINRLLLDRLSATEFPFSHYFLPWRDFALTSYLLQGELQQAPGKREEMSERERTEFAIATRVSRQTLARLATADLLILSGLTPQHPFEVNYLDETIARRHKSRLATIILTPEQPHELALDVVRLGGDGGEAWERMSTTLYETNLVAV